MKNLKSNFHIISWILLIITSAIIIFYTSWFYLGNEETHNILKNELFKNLVLRTLAFSLMGLPTLILVMLIELIWNSKTENKYHGMLKKIMRITLIFLLSSFIGSIVFFFA